MTILKKSKKILVFVVSVLLSNSINVFAVQATRETSSLPEYQQTKSSNVSENISDKEKEALLQKYFKAESAESKKEDAEGAKFETAKAQLEKDGYTIGQDSYAVQGGYDNGSWIVGKYLDGGFWVGMTVYPFNENGECTLDVEAVEGLFNAYAELKANGYSIACDDVTSFYTYFSHGKSPYGAGQITASSWKISKDGQSVTMLPFGNDGKIAISLAAVESTMKTEAAITQLKKDGYTVELNYNSDTRTNYWTVSKKINNSKVSMDVYDFDVNAIEGLFNAYKELKDAGYTIKCDGKNNKIDGNLWTISKNGQTLTMLPFDGNGRIAVSKLSVEYAMKTESAIAQLKKDGYTVNFELDSHGLSTWIIGKTSEDGFWTGMTVYDFDNVKAIEDLFKAHETLRLNGYSVKCDGLSSSYTYHSHGTNPYGAAQITGNDWTISKNGQSIKMSPFGSDGKISVTLDNVKEALNKKLINSIIKNLNGKTSSGYKYTAKMNGDSLIISRTKGKTTQSFKLDTDSNFGEAVISKYNTANKIINNFTTLKTAATTYNSIISTVKSLNSQINLNISRLKSGKITSSLLKTIKNTENSITSLASSLSSKISSLKKVLDNDTYKSLYSVGKSVVNKANSLKSKVNSLTIKNVNTQKNSVISMLNSLKNLNNNLVSMM